MSCDRNDYSVINDADKIVKVNPDSALNLLSTIENPYNLHDKNKADYWRIRSQAHYRKNTAMTTDSLILNSLHYYLNNNDTVNLIESYLLVGEYYRWKNRPDSAIYLFNKGFELTKITGDTLNIPQFLYKSGFTELSRNNKKVAAEYFKTRLCYDKRSHNTYYLLGLISEGDSTKKYIDKSIELALLKGDSLSAAHYIRNYASELLVNKDYSEAIKLIRKTGELSDFYKDFGSNHLILTQIFIATGKLDSAQYYLNRAEKESRKNSFGGYSNNGIIGHNNAVYTLQAVIDAKHNKDINLIPMYRFNDSIINENYKKNRILMEQISERNTLEQQNLKLYINKQRNQITLIIISAFVIFFIIIVYLYFLKRKRKFEEIEERAESLQRLFEEALNVKDEKQSNSQLFRKTLLQQLGIIKLVATTPVKQKSDLLLQIIDISNESISTESLLKWKDLYSIIDSVYDNFYTKFYERYADILIEREIQLCCLLCAGFSTVEISAVMQQSMQTIYQRKSTIRNKLKIKDKEDIISFLYDHI